MDCPCCCRISWRMHGAGSWPDMQGKSILRPDWSKASPEEAHAWLMYRKVCAAPLCTQIAALLAFLTIQLCKAQILSSVGMRQDCATCRRATVPAQEYYGVTLGQCSSTAQHVVVLVRCIKHSVAYSQLSCCRFATMAEH